MSYESARALRTALEQRLKNQATKAGTLDTALLSRLRKRVAFERFLARPGLGIWLHRITSRGYAALQISLSNLEGQILRMLSAGGSVR
jgi:hypothetical protein